jgi:uncharacterized SAM-binding protein YcdF (DUF218 family)
LEPADFIYLFGGDYELRSPAAAALFQQHWSSTIVITREMAPHFTGVTRQILYAHGVPENAVVELAPASPAANTADEARALHAFVGMHPARRIIVVTSPIHSRRARMMVQRALHKFLVDVRVRPAPDKQLSPGEARIELLKFLYYWLTFW